MHGAPDDVAEAALARLGELAPGSTSFAVDELVAVPGDGTPPPLSRLGLIARPTGKTPDQFWTHYRDVHVPMVIRGGPGFSRYSVNRVLTPTPPIDAVVEQWFASDATWREHDRQVREEKDEIRADIANFIGRYFQFRAELAASIPGCAGADR